MRSPIYGTHLDSQKFNFKGSYSETEKGRAIFLVRDIQFKRRTHCNKVLSKYSIWLSSYDTHKESVDKIYQREVTQKVIKAEQSLLHATRRLNLIHIAIKFRPNIPYDYLVTLRTRIVWKENNRKEVTQTLRKSNRFCTRHAVLISYTSL